MTPVGLSITDLWMFPFAKRSDCLSILIFQQSSDASPTEDWYKSFQ